MGAISLTQITSGFSLSASSFLNHGFSAAELLRAEKRRSLVGPGQWFLHRQNFKSTCKRDTWLRPISRCPKHFCSSLLEIFFLSKPHWNWSSTVEYILEYLQSLRWPESPARHSESSAAYISHHLWLMWLLCSRIGSWTLPWPCKVKCDVFL